MAMHREGRCTLRWIEQKSELSVFHLTDEPGTTDLLAGRTDATQSHRRTVQLQFSPSERFDLIIAESSHAGARSLAESMPRYEAKASPLREAESVAGVRRLGRPRDPHLMP